MMQEPCPQKWVLLSCKQGDHCTAFCGSARWKVVGLACAPVILINREECITSEASGDRQFLAWWLGWRWWWGNDEDDVRIEKETNVKV